MFFQELQNAMGETITKINLQITIRGDQLIVAVNKELSETAKKAVPALAVPMVINATAQELDNGFIQALSQHLGQRDTMAKQIEAQEAQTKAAVQKHKPSGAATVVKPASKTENPLNDVLNDMGISADEEQDGEASDPVCSKPATAKAASEEAIAGDDLFADLFSDEK